MKLSGLRICRKSRDLTQLSLARMCGLPEQKVSALETGRQDPSDYEIAKLCEALGVSLTQLRYGLKPDEAIN